MDVNINFKELWENYFLNIFILTLFYPLLWLLISFGHFWKYLSVLLMVSKERCQEIHLKPILVFKPAEPVSTMWHSMEAINEGHVIKKSDPPLQTFQWTIPFILCEEIYTQIVCVYIYVCVHMHSKCQIWIFLNLLVTWRIIFSWSSHMLYNCINLTS